MSFEIPSVSELKHAAETGQRITAADVSIISHAESELTGRGPVRGGPAGIIILTTLRSLKLAMKLTATSNSTEHRNETDEL